LVSVRHLLLGAISHRTKSGKVRKKFGRKAGYRPSDKHSKKVLELHGEGLSYLLIGRNLSLSKNTVMQIVQRAVEVGKVQAA